MEKIWTKEYHWINFTCTHWSREYNPSIREHLGENSGIYVHSHVRETHGGVNNNNGKMHKKGVFAWSDTCRKTFTYLRKGKGREMDLLAWEGTMIMVMETKLG